MKRLIFWGLAAALFMPIPAVSAQGLTLDWQIVPALSGVKRLNSAPPKDGVPGGMLQAIAAKGEIESASFVATLSTPDVRKDKDEGSRWSASASVLTSESGKIIPASAVDIRLVKVWVQAGCAWYSYFSDASGRELVPELLLKDDELVRVDPETMENYLRIRGKNGGTEYYWISNPLEINVPFNPMKEGVADADTLQSFWLEPGKYQQFWVNFEVPADTDAGLYTGAITLSSGKITRNIPVKLRVLPFALPAPKTNYDLNKTFFAGSYNATDLGKYFKESGDLEQSKRRVANEYASFRKHNLLNPLLYAWQTGIDQNIIRTQFEIYRDAGLGTEVLINAVRGIPIYTYLRSTDRKLPLSLQKLPVNWENEVQTGKALVRAVFSGNPEIFCVGWSEPGMGLLRAERLPWKYLHENGLETYTSANSKHLLHGTYNEDFGGYGGIADRHDARIWHEAGARVTAYANPHTGPENPDFVRRTHGLLMYLKDQDGSVNYEVNGSEWNEFLGASYHFRSFNWIYPGAEKPIETIQFEGFREAIDDVRYATLLKQTAAEAMKSPVIDTVYAGKNAMLWLAQIDPFECDLTAVRLEMIRRILELKSQVR